MTPATLTRGPALLWERGTEGGRRWDRCQDREFEGAGARGGGCGASGGEGARVYLSTSSIAELHSGSLVSL